MKYIITRTNGKVTQIWQDNEANWEFFLGGRSSDVHWKNKDDPYRNDKKFLLFHHAKWHLDERARRLKSAVKKNEKEWTYHIIKEEDNGMDH